jgi:acylphosphatase
VQGVWFRASARDEALARGLGGWVRNLADGSVELRAEGPAPALEELIGWCRRGPPLAQVSHVEVQWVFAQGMEGFRILRP